MHSGGNGMTCFTRPHSLSSFERRSLLPVCSNSVFNMSLMADQCALGFCVFNSVDNLCVSMISSFRTHSCGRPGLLVWFIKMKLSHLGFKVFKARDCAHIASFIESSACFVFASICFLQSFCQTCLSKAMELSLRSVVRLWRCL